MSGDDDSIYAEVLLPYRDMESCKERPQIRSLPELGRMEIPDRPGAGTPFNEITIKPTSVIMLDGRKLIKKGEVFDMDKHAFDFHMGCPSQVQNWENPQEVFTTYFPQVEALVRASVPEARHPAAQVLVFDHALRTGGKGLGDAMKSNSEAGWGPYAATVHSDNSIRSMHSRAKDWLLGTNEVERRYGGYPAGWGSTRPHKENQRRLFRSEAHDHGSPEGIGGEHMIVNVWRPLATVENWGLCVLDGRTLADGDAHPTALQYMDPSSLGAAIGAKKQEVTDLDGKPLNMRVNEALTPLHDPSHRWVYFPKMQPDEALVFKIFDSRRDGRVRAGCHTAFKDPLGVPGAHRSSIEVRTLVILPPEASTASTASKL